MSQRIICIGGAHSGCGKTTVAEILLRNLEGDWGAIKYTKTAFYSSVTEVTEENDLPGKDTARLRASGAKRVIWVQSPEDQVQEPLQIALNLLSECQGVVVEGNSAIEFLNPDIVIFVFGEDKDRIKPSAERIIPRADIVVSQAPSADERIKTIVLSETDAEKTLMEEIERLISSDSQERLRERVLKEARNGRLPCARARAIAEEEGVSYKEIGMIADRLKVKISNCELGCF